MKTTKKRIIALIAVLLAVSGVFAGFRIYQSYLRQITGQEWFEKQDKYIEEMKTYADGLDDIFALYLSKSISDEDFLNHLTILKNELSIMKAAYEDVKDEHPVKTGSHTYSSKKGCEAVEGCYEILNQILDMASVKENYADIETLGYKYLAYQQNIIDNLANYMAAKEIMESENN